MRTGIVFYFKKCQIKPKEVEVPYSNEGNKYLIMNIITNVKALSVKLMQPIRCFKNRLTLKYFTYLASRGIITVPPT